MIVHATTEINREVIRTWRHTNLEWVSGAKGLLTPMQKTCLPLVISPKQRNPKYYRPAGSRGNTLIDSERFCDGRNYNTRQGEEHGYPESPCHDGSEYHFISKPQCPEGVNQDQHEDVLKRITGKTKLRRNYAQKIERKMSSSTT